MTELSLAEARAAAARQRLTNTVDVVRTRLDPRTIARDTVEKIADTGERVVRDGVETARRNPALVAGAIALIGLWFGRKKIAALYIDARKSPQPAPPRRVGTTRPRPVPAKRNLP